MNIWKWITGQETDMYDRKSLEADYQRAMKSNNVKFIQEVLHRWSIDIGDNAEHIALHQHLYRVTKGK